MYDSYESPFSARYASAEMQHVFSPQKKFSTWRRLWVALARAEMKNGLPITEEQVAELEAHVDDINFEVAKEREKLVRHDVMSHVYAYGVQCPNAKGIIHLGATSCYVGDNTDIILMRDALQIVRRKLVNVLDLLGKFAEQYKSMPALAVYPPAAGTADHRRQTCNAVDERTADGFGRNRLPSGKLEAPRLEGHHRYAGVVHGTF